MLEALWAQIKYLSDRYHGKTVKGLKRSSKWPKIREEHLKKEPLCQLCGGKKSIEVHHIIPFSLDASLELDPGNLITLCEEKKFGVNCHLWMGHLGNYVNFNPVCFSDIEEWKEKIKLSKQWKKDYEQVSITKDVPVGV